jgi:hypothetical protein
MYFLFRFRDNLNATDRERIISRRPNSFPGKRNKMTKILWYLVSALLLFIIIYYSFSPVCKAATFIHALLTIFVLGYDDEDDAYSLQFRLSFRDLSEITSVCVCVFFLCGGTGTSKLNLANKCRLDRIRTHDLCGGGLSKIILMLQPTWNKLTNFAFKTHTRNLCASY